MAKKTKHSFIKEDDHSFLIHDGEKHFAVAKKGVAEDMHERIRGLPKYALGGVVDTDAPLPKPGSFEEAQQKDVAAGFIPPPEPEPLPGTYEYAVRKDAGTLKAPAAAVVEGERVPATPVSPEEIVAAVPTPAPQVVAAQAQNAERAMSMAPIIAEQRAGAKLQAEGIQAQSNAEAGLAEATQKFYDGQKLDEQAAAQKKRMDDLMAQQQKIEGENEALYQAAMNNKIDPNRVYNNMSTGNRVLASIAIILGGAGGGSDPAKNAALQVINKAIDRDIDAQMKAGDNARNLYQINLQKYRDVNSAMDATRLQMNAIAQGQLAGLTAKFGGQKAKANGDAMLGALKSQSATIQAGLLEKQSQIYENMAQAEAKKAAGSGKNPEFLVPGYGYAQVKPSEKDRDVLARTQNVMKGINELQQNAAKFGTTVPGSTQDKRNKALVADTILKMKEIYNLGVLNPADKEIIGELIADPGAFMTGRAIEQLETAKQSVSGVESSTINKLGLQSAGGDGAPKISFEEFQKRKKAGKL